MPLSYFVRTFGCAANAADSERIASYLLGLGMKKAKDITRADYVVINTCMVREMAENRVYGLVNNLVKSVKRKAKRKIVLTGCMVGMAVRDKTGRFLRLLKKKMPLIDEFLPIEEIGFDYPQTRTDKEHALVPISNGCNNFCSYCVVPFSRGREISRPYEEIINECIKLTQKGYKKITLLGQNVNSYGADLVLGSKKTQVLKDINKKHLAGNLTMKPFDLVYTVYPECNRRKQSRSAQGKQFTNETISGYKLPDNRVIKPILVKHLGRLRIPTLFPYLLEDVCKIKGIEFVDFMSSNPWDFSGELIDMIAKNPKITRQIHLPVQSGSNTVLKRMNRWYTRDEYLELVDKLKAKIPAKGSVSGGENIKISTDIIVGFCGETEEEFLETVDLVKKVRFCKAYIAMYSDRPMTTAHKAFKDDVTHKEKKRRWRILEELINRH